MISKYCLQLGALFVSVCAGAQQGWISHRVPLADTRPSVRDSRPVVGCDLEVLEYDRGDRAANPSSVALLIPGLFQNVYAFDLLPDQGISYARYLETQKNMHVYVLHVRGIGNSCYPGRSNLDDLAIDDVPAALTFVQRKESLPVIAIGHSQGGLVLQASLSGLTRCSWKRNCFSDGIAAKRQRLIQSAGIMGSNADLSGIKFKVQAIAWLDLLLPNFGVGLDRITAEGTVKKIIKDPESDAWEGVYHKPNTSPESRKAFYDLTLDASSVGILNQYGRGIRGNGLRSSSLQRYSKAMKRLKIPTAEIVFEYDLFAPPRQTERDNFNRIGSATKAFFLGKGQGHLDFMMNAQLHETTSDFIDWLINIQEIN